MKIVAVSDTHREFNKLKIPKADVFIHAGDIDCYEFSSELRKFNTWLGTVPCTHKLIVAGNHDGFIDRNPVEATRELLTNGTYLEHEGITIDGVNFWGSPITPQFNNWYFMMGGEGRKEHWENIPMDTDILITHGPPMDILDELTIGGRHVGCQYLAERIKKVKPKVHIFGHIHETAGIHIEEGITYMNCSLMDECYSLVHKPTEFFYYKEVDELIL